MAKKLRSALVLAATVGLSAVGIAAAGAAPAFAQGPPNPLCAPSTPHCPGPNPTSPVVIDVDGSGFHLTSAAHGVRFDFFGNGHPIQMAWIAPGSTNAFLVLPRDGKVTNASEMFGNITPQPASADPNGFLALARFAGGRDVIDSRTPIYARLRLWQFSNDHGKLVAGRLSTLPQLGIEAIYLNFTTTGQADGFGNAFRYQARVVSSNPRAGKYAYDVFLVNSGVAAGQRTGGGADTVLVLVALLPVAVLLGLTPVLRGRRSRVAASVDGQETATERQSDLVS